MVGVSFIKTLLHILLPLHWGSCVALHYNKGGKGSIQAHLIHLEHCDTVESLHYNKLKGTGTSAGQRPIRLLKIHLEHIGNLRSCSTYEFIRTGAWQHTVPQVKSLESLPRVWQSSKR